MLKLCLVGHRGVGKSHFLKGLLQRFPQCQGVSLDDAIAQKKAMSTTKYFEAVGEAEFRKTEFEVLQELVEKFKQVPFIVDIGAGFLGPLPSNFQCLWLQRSVDLSKARFLDRPQLDKGRLIATHRFIEREKRYESWATISLELNESLEFLDSWGDWFSHTFLNPKKSSRLMSSWWMTVLDSKMLSVCERYKIFANLEFEFRDDLIASADWHECLHRYPKALFSLRDKNLHKKHREALSSRFLWDWPLEWGRQKEAPILSLHQRGSTLLETLRSLPQSHESIVKLAIPIENFKELDEGDRWQQESPERRVFLPLSQEGRWSWYRQLRSSTQPIKFLRWGKGSGADQPTVLQAMELQSAFKSWGAVLGQPVRHSISPTYHGPYFKKRRSPFFAVDCGVSEWDSAKAVLPQWGLKAAAVTSPLKELAGECAGMKSANTLFYGSTGWVGTETDSWGFLTYSSILEGRRVAVWGGGGVYFGLQTAWQRAGQKPENLAHYSSRTGDLKSPGLAFEPDVIVWAVGAQNFAKSGIFPPQQWRPECVIDLNYTSDSPGLECAKNYGVPYYSGQALFRAQANRQQEFWNECGF